MLKTAKAERIELYKDRDIQVLLGKFLTGEMLKIEPVFNPKTGYHYPQIEAIVGEPSKAQAFLNKLYEAEILERELYDKVVLCAKCKSANVAVRYCCPYCKVFDIEKSSLIEHVKCGYMDVEENFQKNERLVCPKCGEELQRPDVDYRKAGIWCTCKECGKSFDIPNVTHFCRDCRESSAFEDVTIRSVYSYRLREEAKEEAGLGWILMAPLKEFLADEGFDVEGPAFLKGRSGANHLFDLVASKSSARNKKRTTVIDIARSSEGAVSEQPVIALFAKIFDVSPDEAFLIAIPKINENGKKMAELYSIRVIEARNQSEVVKLLKDRITKD